MRSTQPPWKLVIITKVPPLPVTHLPFDQWIRRQYLKGNEQLEVYHLADKYEELAAIPVHMEPLNTVCWFNPFRLKLEPASKAIHAPGYRGWLLDKTSSIYYRGWMRPEYYTQITTEPPPPRLIRPGKGVFHAILIDKQTLETCYEQLFKIENAG